MSNLGTYAMEMRAPRMRATMDSSIHPPLPPTHSLRFIAGSPVRTCTYPPGWFLVGGVNSPSRKGTLRQQAKTEMPPSPPQTAATAASCSLRGAEGGALQQARLSGRSLHMPNAHPRAATRTARQGLRIFAARRWARTERSFRPAPAPTHAMAGFPKSAGARKAGRRRWLP